MCEFRVRYSGRLEIQMDREAGDNLIGRFVDKNGDLEGMYHFSENWNHLIQVVEVIEKMGVTYTCEPTRDRAGRPKEYLAMFEPNFKIKRWKDREEVLFGREIGSDRLESTWKAVVYFLLWYGDKD
jgi:hypothetical protein